jgi:hypothetical protein
LSSSDVIADKFEESKENKLEYTEIFGQYTNFVESSIEKHLSSKIPVRCNVIPVCTVHSFEDL